MKSILIIFLVAVTISCNMKEGKQPFKKTGSIERIDPLLDSIIHPQAQPEIIAEGFEWSEGPVWIESEQMLLFSDVPRNRVYQWTEEKGTSIYLEPSGYTSSKERGGEMGSNGLLLDNEGNLVLCQHGNRQMARMKAPLNQPMSEFETLTGNYDGKKYNSPNDAAYSSKGDLFFTDPPYGLEKQMEDPGKEIPFQGVYQLSAQGTVRVLSDSITRPNGIALFPGEKKLLIANSDPGKPHWYLFNLENTDSIISPTIFHSAEGAGQDLKGLPDGLKVDKKGNVFATGPGGVWIFNSGGKLLGKIKLQEASSNVALSADEKTIYITNDMYVLRLKLKK